MDLDSGDPLLMEACHVVGILEDLLGGQDEVLVGSIFHCPYLLINILMRISIRIREGTFAHFKPNQISASVTNCTSGSRCRIECKVS